MSDLGLFLSGQKLSNAAFAAALEMMMEALGHPAERVSAEAVRRWALPSTASDFRRPKPAFMPAIYVLTDGVVGPQAFGGGVPEISDRMRRKAQTILSSVKASVAQRKHEGRAKGAKGAARSRRVLAEARDARAGAR